MFDQSKPKDQQEAPEHGLPGKIVAITIIAIVIACMLLSGYGNIQTWTSGLQGVDYWINFGTGIISEIIGAVLLVVIIWSLARPTVPRILVALLFFPVWGMATFQNASASWSYYVEASNAEEEAALIANAKVKADALRTRINLAEERISEIKSELEFIGMTRTPDEIRAERDRLPTSYRTRRAELTAELNKAERRITLDEQLITQRKQLATATTEGASSDNATGPVLGQVAKGQTTSADVKDVWSFMAFVQTNRLGSLVLVMEVMKSFGLLLINVVFAGNAVRKANKVHIASNQNEAIREVRQRRVRNDGFEAQQGFALSIASSEASPQTQETTHENVVKFVDVSQRADQERKTAPAPPPTKAPVKTQAKPQPVKPAAPKHATEPKDETKEGDDAPAKIGIASKFV